MKIIDPKDVKKLHDLKPSSIIRMSPEEFVRLREIYENYIFTPCCYEHRYVAKVYRNALLLFEEEGCNRREDGTRWNEPSRSTPVRFRI